MKLNFKQFILESDKSFWASLKPIRDDILVGLDFLEDKGSYSSEEEKIAFAELINKYCDAAIKHAWQTSGIDTHYQYASPEEQQDEPDEVAIAQAIYSLEMIHRDTILYIRVPYYFRNVISLMRVYLDKLNEPTNTQFGPSFASRWKVGRDLRTAQRFLLKVAERLMELYGKHF
jgi:hypothetical protein